MTLTCKKCHRPFPETAPTGPCPACLAAERQTIPLPDGLAIAGKAAPHDPKQRFQAARALVRLLLAACITGALLYGGYRWHAGSGSSAPIDAKKPVPSANHPEPAAPPVVVAKAAQKELIRDRSRAYEGKLEGDKVEFQAEWGGTFATNRAAAAAEASKRIVAAANQIRASRRIDAIQLKSHPEFKGVIRREIKEVLNAEKLRTELEAWAQGVETQTRTRMIRYFQQVIAEDLGRSFDENLRSIVVKAVREIPVEKLIADADAVAKIDAAILASLPESALSESSRKLIKEAAVQLTKVAAFKLAAASGAGQFSGILAEGAGMIADPLIEEGLLKLNEAITASPDPNAVKQAMIKALTEWNNANLKPRMEKTLSDFNRAIIRFLEDEARVQSGIVP
jgi:hypothetical protein